MWGALGGLCALLGAATARGVVARADAWNLWQLASPVAPPHASSRQIAVRLATAHTQYWARWLPYVGAQAHAFSFWASNGVALAMACSGRMHVTTPCIHMHPSCKCRHDCLCFYRCLFASVKAQHKMAQIEWATLLSVACGPPVNLAHTFGMILELKTPQLQVASKFLAQNA